MGNVITFRARATAVRVTPQMRAQLEDAAQHALDTADCLIALLDRCDGDPGRDGGEEERQVLHARPCDPAAAPPL